MARRLRPLPYRKVARGLSRLGFRPIRQSGSHVRWKHDDGRASTVPNHPGRDIDPWLLRKILREADVALDEFLRHR